ASRSGSSSSRKTSSPQETGGRRGASFSSPFQHRVRILSQVLRQRPHRLGGARQLLDQIAQVVILPAGAPHELFRTSGRGLRGGRGVLQALRDGAEVLARHRSHLLALGERSIAALAALAEGGIVDEPT